MITINHKEEILQAEMIVTFARQSLSISVYFVDGILIDTGPAKCHHTLASLYERWEIEQVFLTHHHEDHTGLAPWLQIKKQLPVYIHEVGIPICQKKANLPMYRRLLLGKRESFEPLAFKNEHEGNRYKWEIINTPGHTNDHVAIYNREKGWMFGGDLYVLPHPKSMFAFESVPLMINSLQSILTYDFDTYICAHAGIIQSGKIVIKKKLDYLENIRGEILYLYEQGMSVQEIRKRLFPRRHPLHYFSFFENSPSHLVRSSLSKI
ncbi:MBL fold metallo-hydrolase [Bacillus chungangensis]|uniref:Glyoxylase-like metal-dependent hydrolase (Beta-lactamase superfamily II) n=1 Tax=Bacillus chungangensis TaxID=587633 RepID=A0ABT9WVY4_9BACI|nr:MBL fold metallo-hydrolase [Bacillus chungangensis]MDQ0177457.1 glyoxylase-like metal-dependent hydrolase (beta-lactamase superfamily II) [Bacillus chungangensis]